MDRLGKLGLQRSTFGRDLLPFLLHKLHLLQHLAGICLLESVIEAHGVDLLLQALGLGLPLGGPRLNLCHLGLCLSHRQLLLSLLHLRLLLCCLLLLRRHLVGRLGDPQGIAHPLGKLVFIGHIHELDQHIEAGCLSLGRQPRHGLHHPLGQLLFVGRGLLNGCQGDMGAQPGHIVGQHLPFRHVEHDGLAAPLVLPVDGHLHIAAL
ncbi:hypothetical protein D3C77_555920 [compost metagenome]